jgi:hypothetical protein
MFALMEGRRFSASSETNSLSTCDSEESCSGSLLEAFAPPATGAAAALLRKANKEETMRSLEEQQLAVLEAFLAATSTTDLPLLDLMDANTEDLRAWSQASLESPPLSIMGEERTASRERDDLPDLCNDPMQAEKQFLPAGTSAFHHAYDHAYHARPPLGSQASATHPSQPLLFAPLAYRSDKSQELATKSPEMLETSLFFMADTPLGMPLDTRDNAATLPAKNVMTMATLENKKKKEEEESSPDTSRAASARNFDLMLMRVTRELRSMAVELGKLAEEARED